MSSFDGYFEGQRIVMVVGQQPFSPSAYPDLVFCSLLPLILEDGSIADGSDFPVHGNIWWKIRAGAKQLAEPGRLLRGTLERAQNAGKPDNAIYQAQTDNIDPLHPKDFVEILTVPSASVLQERDLISESFSFLCDHPPMETVYVIFRNNVCGPFRTSSQEHDSLFGSHVVKLQAHQQDKTIVSFPISYLNEIPKAKTYKLEVTVSLATSPVHNSNELHKCSYWLFEGAAFGNAVPRDAKRHALYSDREVLARVSKDILKKKRRREFLSIYDELYESFNSGASSPSEDESVVLTSIKNSLNSNEAAVSEVARSILESGLIDQQLEKAREEALRGYVNEHATRLQSQIDLKLEEKKRDRDRLEKELQNLDSKLRTQRKEREAQLEIELEARRQKQVAEEQKLAVQREALEHQSRVLKGSLEKVSEELKINRDGIINQFLTIHPLLSSFSMLPENSGLTGDGTHPGREPAQPELRFPFYVVSSREEKPTGISEMDFLERFRNHVEESGFKHRLIDLIRFHLSVKCGEITILGGYPGTGKSSLPRLYEEALLGKAAQNEADRFLRISVSPSWLDMRDLLGHLNALDGLYQPGESGLYQLLISAEKEFELHSSTTGLYMVCLDEMNLAHVEHYFSGFLQALEQPAGQRIVRCFSPEVVKDGSAFSGWASLNIPLSVKFVGTVNFDETTRQLSQRLLDRCNLIRLQPDLPLGMVDVTETASPLGEPITLREYLAWNQGGTEGLEEGLAEIIDKLRKPLAVLGSSLNPRKFHAIRKFISMCPREFLSPTQALDVQIAQRLLPQARNLFSTGSLDAVREIRTVLQTRMAEFPESLSSLEEVAENELIENEG